MDEAVEKTGGAVRRRPARERLLRAAAHRFYADGVSATGIDTITDQAGVAKKSLYNNFASKAELVQAYLEGRHEEWLGLYRARLERAQDARGRVLAVFDAYVDHAEFEYEQGFRGCGLLNVAAELPAGDEGRAVVRRYKEDVEALLVKHLEELLPGRPEQVHVTAEHLSFLLEGATVRAGLEGGSSRIRQARVLAAELLEQL
ncbi:TetR/AcrR family transcriptional regulator [Streptomyces brasiliensis]|uniref:TetR family transcriptional regulator n=1 Tax=Streptomyces brasiliensis TaxID=1954 RepID=A0A917K7M9_9ACTN|nr:TetR/AcrR family transcriptional regulator [Streptomyces brasiliensis]GGJ03652.1 TetR family transcriptional regulator [Streptomyces brasiliensis]